MKIRRATTGDAAAIASLFAIIAAERIYSAIDVPFTEEQERDYIASMSDREAVFMAEDESGLAGLQSIDLWAKSLHSMRHVGQIGTFLMPSHRGRGVGRMLWNESRSFAMSAGYGKLIAQVRASNTRAQGFYRSLGFVECGRLSRQVMIDGCEDDEVLLEWFSD